MAENLNNNNQIQWFKGVWNLHTAPKIKMLLWKTFQQALPVAEILANRHITTENLCRRCGSPESIDHLFIHCNYAQQVWRVAPFATDLDLSGLIDFNGVWISLCSKVCLPPTGLSLGPLAPWIVWQLWTARNQLIFTGKEWTAEETLTKAISQAREWNNSQNQLQGNPKKTNCSPPRPPNCVTLNTDAAWKTTTQKAGLGWVITDQRRATSFSQVVPYVGFVFCAEALALRAGLLKCKELGIKRIVCESDSSHLIKTINSGDPIPEVYGIISDIFDISWSFDVIVFVWIPRGMNLAADKAAKLCLVGEDAIMALPT